MVVESPYNATDIHRVGERHAVTHQRAGEDELFGVVPYGGIIMWSGAVAEVPEGWAICDGENGTPNLVDRFIVGAGSTYDPADTGGSATALISSHEGTAVSEHSGAGASLSNNHAGTHTHGITRATSGGDFGPGAVPFVVSVDTPTGAESADPTAHVVTNTQAGPHVVTDPDDHAAIATLPPYYALAFIMRIQQ
jgi:hypothetical protein